ncbi:MAG TPA: serine/threonine-protein kinase, partial [Pirellulales bacterium]|nr:serine/threonine-protein kinase [Pirellulales bacterium]
MNPDREILLGVLAYELGFVERAVLVEAAQQWSSDRNKPLSALLVERGELTAERLSLVDALVREQLRLHDGDPARALASISSRPPVGAELERIVRPPVQATLADVSLTLPSLIDEDDVPARTLGAPTSAAGRFRILRSHAKGGLGEVFVAHDGELNRDVAVKQIQQHADASASRARFLLEAEITGGLEHPGVVPVYGLGTDADGRPFYAMRFIQGESLKEAIKRFHGRRSQRTIRNPQSFASLEFRKLLGSFIDVCNAIEYAHSRGFLHRDLKPDNVMLGKFGETLVVDWGLAKPIEPGRDHDPPAKEIEIALASGLPPGQATGATSPTVMGSAVGTPPFMSPEQAEGRLDRIGRASDVYSLGATLYYLLTGFVPFNEPGVLRLLERVKRGEFSHPREANRAVPSALDAIALRAMALDPAQRYSSARALADDLERWLADEPVSAHRATWSERLARRARRHRRGVQAATAALLVITIVSVVATVMIRAAKRDLEHEHALVKTALQAETEAKEQARKAIDNYVHLVTEEHVLRDEGVQPLRKRLLQDARRYYDDLIEKHGDDEKLGHELAGAILRVGRINHETGSKDEAIKAFRQALDLFEQLAVEHPDEAESYQSDMALCLRSLGIMTADLSRHEASLENFERALGIERKLVDTHPDDARHRRDLALLHFHAGDAQWHLRREQQAVAHYQHAMEIQRNLVQREPTRTTYQVDLSETLSAIGRLRVAFGHPQAALAPLEDSSAIRTALVEAHPAVAKYQSDLADSFHEVGRVQVDLIRWTDALASFQTALRVRRKSFDDHPGNARFRSALAAAWDDVGRAGARL